MELRKIQRTGGGTFFVCLPKEWAERNGLEKGAVVAVSETANGRLVVDPKYGIERAPQTVVIKPGPYIDREIVGKYLLGYDIIRVEAKDRITLEDRERVKQAASRLVGLEIIEEDHSKIVMQCLLEPSSFPPEKILRREYSIAASIHRDAATALIDGDVHLARSVVARDNEVNRLYFLLVRILRTIIQNPGLSEKLGLSPIDCLDYRLIASLVEAIGDQAVQVGLETVELKGIKFPTDVAELVLKFHRQIYVAHEDALKALFSHDIALAESVRDLRGTVEDLKRQVEKVVSETPSLAKFSARILAATSSMELIYDHSVDAADLIMPKISS